MSHSLYLHTRTVSVTSCCMPYMLFGSTELSSASASRKAPLVTPASMRGQQAYPITSITMPRHTWLLHVAIALHDRSASFRVLSKGNSRTSAGTNSCQSQTDVSYCPANIDVAYKFRLASSLVRSAPVQRLTLDGVRTEQTTEVRSA